MLQRLLGTGILVDFFFLWVRFEACFMLPLDSVSTNASAPIS